ncbi:MAG: glycoside hydrolase family 3 C-terminal domain-containing protein [Prevotella sp.]|nr:glycoside hydrolase family 3 C-terminal domain-containing protein [Prevotella sp.]
MKKFILSSLMVMTSLASNAQDTAKYPWLDTSKSFHERAVLLCKELTLREKFDQLGNIVSEAIKRDGVTILPSYQYWNEAIHGVARSGAATSFPESKGMSATWDRKLIYDCASITSDEARRYYLDQNKGLNYWSPTINMAREPRWGREEENYGEDPFLAGELAVPFIRGFQGSNFDGSRSTPYLKLVACAKHFAANNYEQGRQSTTSFVNEKNMREYYLPAFEACVKEANVKSIMSAYNALSIDPTEKHPSGAGFVDAKGGLPMSANKMLLTDILRGEWGFDGYVTSDCAAIACIHRATKHLYFGNYTAGTIDDGTAFATIHSPYANSTEEEQLMEARSTALAIKAGCNTNCEFKNRSSVYQRAGMNAVSNDLQGYDNLTEEDVDKALIPMLETRFALGEFEKADCPWNNNVPALETKEHQAMALKAAQESIVLMKNEGNILPITTDKKVALIGPYANAIMLGDYSGTPTYTTTPFEAFSAKMNFTTPKNTTRSCSVDAVPFDQAVVSKRGATNNDKGAGNLENTAPGDVFKYENVWFGENGCTNFEMVCGAKNTGVGKVSFILDSKDGTPFLTVDNLDTGGWTTWKSVTATVDPAVVKGKHDLYIKFSGSNSYCGNYKSFTFSNPSSPIEEPIPAIETEGPLYLYSPTQSVNDRYTDAQIQRAVDVAKRADVVIFLTGTNFEKPDDHHTGTEGHDRWIIGMPGNQETMLKALYEANKNTVLVLETGSSMDIKWAKENVPAIVEAWYGGQAQGQAICDAIYGDINPSGKLTSTWYNSLDELPSRTDEQAESQVFKRDQHGMLFYDIDTWGYTYMYYGKAKHGRQATAPQFPFGYGLSYTTFEYSNLTAPSTIGVDGTINVTATIKNTGSRDGAEVVQLYANWNGKGENGKKNKKLIGFERIELKAGESKTVTIPVKYEQFSYFDTTTHQYKVDSADVTLELAASSADVRQTKMVKTAAGVAKETYISENATSIEAIASSAQLMKTDHIYSVMGDYVCNANGFDSLPKGIYVLNGVKYIKK